MSRTTKETERERERDVLFFSSSDQPVVQLLPIGRTVSLDCAISAGRQPSVSADYRWISSGSVAVLDRGKVSAVSVARDDLSRHRSRLRY